MMYDFTIRKSSLDGAMEVSAKDWLVARFHTRTAFNVFLAGASALKLSVYDRDAGHGLIGTLDQVLNEGAN